MSRFEPLEHTSSWRRISTALWQEHRSPQVLGFDEIDMTTLQARVPELREELGTRVTVTHIVVKAVAAVLAEHPDLNVVLRRGRVQRRKHVDVFVQVAIPASRPGEADLSGVPIRDANEKDLSNIASELSGRAQKMRAGQDEDMGQIKELLNVVPGAVLGKLMHAMSSLSFDAGLDLSALGLHPDPFGSAMVTNCAGFGIDVGLAPLTPLSRTPMIFLLGETRNRPVVVDGEVVVRPIMRVGGTFDHRLFDGYQIGLITREIKAILEHRDRLDDAIRGRDD